MAPAWEGGSEITSPWEERISSSFLLFSSLLFHSTFDIWRSMLDLQRVYLRMDVFHKSLSEVADLAV